MQCMHDMTKFGGEVLMPVLQAKTMPTSLPVPVTACLQASGVSIGACRVEVRSATWLSRCGVGFVFGRQDANDRDSFRPVSSMTSRKTVCAGSSSGCTPLRNSLRLVT